MNIRPLTFESEEKEDCVSVPSWWWRTLPLLGQPGDQRCSPEPSNYLISGCRRFPGHSPDPPRPLSSGGGGGRAARVSFINQANHQSWAVCPSGGIGKHTVGHMAGIRAAEAPPTSRLVRNQSSRYHLSASVPVSCLHISCLTLANPKM